MADVAMCQDRSCPMRARCYRYRAIPHKFQQSYSEFMWTRDDAFDCNGYWDCSEYVEKNLVSMERLEPGYGWYEESSD